MSVCLLEDISSPSDLKKLAPRELEILASEVRELLIRTVRANGGHLASNLGVVELSLALHRVFASPEDKIVWDVGHQCYTHKLLTGRTGTFDTLRRKGGLSGFPVRSESPHDCFGAGHAGTSISAALGMALARDLTSGSFHVVAVIGDGSLDAGMAVEALNHAGRTETRLIIVLNDNGMAISPCCGWISRLMNRIRFDPWYKTTKNAVQEAVSHLPFGRPAWELGERLKKHLEQALLPGAFWNGLGLSYLGPVDGHDLRETESALRRAAGKKDGPVLLHLITRKGKGYAPAEENATRFHGVEGGLEETVRSGPTYSQVFGRTVLWLMERDPRVVAVCAAMIDGAGLAEAAERYPERVFDVGICEQHAVTLAAGLAAEGMVPIVAIYSTFLQRSYDQIIHDVCLQDLPVVFAVDRSGLVGDDGKTHQGMFDLSFLRSIPNMVVSAAADENQLQHLIYTAAVSPKPVAVRYPRGRGSGATLDRDPRKLPLGTGRLLVEGSDAAILAVGAVVAPALEAAGRLREAGASCAVVDARFVKPLDAGLIDRLAEQTGRILTVEENVLAGGFGSAVAEHLHAETGFRGSLEMLALPDAFVEHGSREELLRQHRLDAAGICEGAKRAFPELFLRDRAGTNASSLEGVR